jgi:hypothetical protein
MRSVKVAPASRFGHREELRGYLADLEQRGHMVASRWIKGNHQSTCPAEQRNVRRLDWDTGQEVRWQG